MRLSVSRFKEDEMASVQQTQAAVLSAFSRRQRGKKEKQREAKGTGTLKHGALKRLPLRHNVGIMHGEASCYVKIILDGSL